jgi:hypothetical protein
MGEEIQHMFDGLEMSFAKTAFTLGFVGHREGPSFLSLVKLRQHVPQCFALVALASRRLTAAGSRTNR